MLKKKVLEQLKKTDKHVSGQELSLMLSVSRTAIWKAISSLKKEGYSIEAVNNKGYKLLEVRDILNESELSDKIGKDIEIRYQSDVDSTNLWAKRLYEEEEVKKSLDSGKYILLAADSQSQGKGRRGRSWCSKEGEGIWMSLLFKRNIRVDRISMLTLVAALAVNKAIESVCGLESFIKWPNDIVYEGKKLCGILTEMSADIDGVKYIICGIGINVNVTSFDKEIEEIATSIKLASGKDIARVELIAKIIENFLKLCEEFIKSQDFSLLKYEYEKHLININRTVKIIEQNTEYEAVAIGINDMGELLIKKADEDKLINIFSGEVSVRGIYGYT